MTISSCTIMKSIKITYKKGGMLPEDMARKHEKYTRVGFLRARRVLFY